MDAKSVRIVRVVKSYQLSFSVLCAVVLYGAPSSVMAQSIAAAVPGAHAMRAAAVTLTVTDAELESVLRMISQQASLKLVAPGKVMPPSRRVTMQVRAVSVHDAFAIALAGTGLRATIMSDMAVVAAADSVQDAVVQGVVIGNVISRSTRLPIRGATITVDGVIKGSVTGDDGRFRLSGVPAGTHTLHVRALGYERISRSITLAAGQTIISDVALDVSAAALDQVVVTGTVVSTELRSVPNAVTVVTARDLEERGITKIDQLFRGDVPGLYALEQGAASPVDQVTMFSRGATGLHDASGQTKSQGVSKGTNPIKTYVDGVEVTDAQFMNEIDPRSIERIEIVSGPQASTIYGSNAINGVMQIFTKRAGSRRPQFTVTLMTGWLQNNFSSAFAPQHDHNAQITGTEGHISYNAGATYYYMAPWSPAKQTARTGVFGGARLQRGVISADASLRLSKTRNNHKATPGQATMYFRQTGYYTPSSQLIGEQPRNQQLGGQTVGFTLGYTPFDWLSAEAGAGMDKSEYEIRYSGAGFLSPSDTLLFMNNSSSDRRSLRGRLTARAPIATYAQGIITVGADSWERRASVVAAWPSSYNGALNGTRNVTLTKGHNAGGFLQSQLDLFNRIFVTYGLRVEWNPGFGEDANPNIAPRYGLAVTQDMGPVTAKLRGTWGRATRPPLEEHKLAQSAQSRNVDAAVLRDFGNFDFYVSNPYLGPEHQSGAEGGIELYIANRASLVVTRYNQTVDRLILQIQGVDSTRSLVPTTLGQADAGDGYRWYYQYQHLNSASIRNQGWELQGSGSVGPLTARGTYSWTKSRVIGVTEEYQRLVTNQPAYSPGASLQYLPEHTWAASLSYAHAQTSVMLTVNGTGMTRGTNAAFYNYHVSPTIRLMPDRATTRSFPWDHVNPGYALAHLNMSHRLSPHAEGIVQVQNMADRYHNDVSAATATAGRQTKVGMRLRF